MKARGAPPRLAHLQPQGRSHLHRNCHSQYRVQGHAPAGPAYIFEFRACCPSCRRGGSRSICPRRVARTSYQDPVDVGLNLATLGQVLGLFPITRGWAVLFKTIETIHNVHSVYDVLFKVPNDCVVKAYSLGPLPHAYAYGASRLGQAIQAVRKGTVNSAV